MQPKTDLRVIKTQANIKNTFIELLSKKTFTEITIQNILDQALINRSTFYKHYSDKYELAEQLIDEIMKKATVFITERFSNMKGDELFSIIYKAYEYVYDNKKTILALWKIRTDKLHPYDDLQGLLKKYCMEYLTAHNAIKDSSMLDYYSTLYASLGLTTIKWILECGNEPDIVKIIEQFKYTLRGSLWLKTNGGSIDTKS
ncbi:TetR family transcriptional regulator [Clostridium chromiireducens]|uniref:TetR family transcriptional regulator n=1 Tax=Clostridium chromiireducens TaxID=225345 RepID=A0A964RPR2_9CLOT|nr:TetR family transcriptional regulator [Clostridium chromiireducens]MVX65568.1 TetR family transcriptional regulator [Clostridium chromiireducens]